MFDERFYAQILNAAYEYLNRNGNRYGQQFARGFIEDHDYSRTRTPQSEQYAQSLFTYISRRAQHANGSLEIRGAEQLFLFVSDYVEDIFAQWQRANMSRQGGTMFSNNQSFGFGNGGSMFSGQPQFTSSMAGTGTQAAPPPPQPTQQQAAPAAMPIIQSTTSYTPNPLDKIDEGNPSLTFVTEKKSWGLQNPSDRSIVILSRNAWKTSDDRFTIHQIDGFERIYMNDPFNVVKDFFRIIPDTFLAEIFTFRIFYNHVETVEIPTEDFIKVRDRLTQALSSSGSATIYDTLMHIMSDGLYHGPRMAMADYLVKHINRALYLSLGSFRNPEQRIRFTQIEDLKDLLGTSFQSQILEIPNARSIIVNIVNTAIMNAIVAYSNVMFVSPVDPALEIMKSNDLFPYAMDGVYPNKAAIPNDKKTLQSTFYDQIGDFELKKRTYIRSIRSVVITNALGQGPLSQIIQTPRVIEGVVPSVLDLYKINHRVSVSADAFECWKYDELIVRDQDGVDPYTIYLDDPLGYNDREVNKFADSPIPSIPVDQTAYAIQFKKSPKEFLLPFDILDVIDADRDKRYSIFAKRDVELLKPIS